MTLKIEEIMDAAGAVLGGSVRWGTPLDVRQPGVYIVALTTEPHSGMPVLLERAPLDLNVVCQWLDRSPLLTLDGVRPTAQALAQRLNSFWIPNEIILYIGKTGRPLSKRISEYYDTELGERHPHAGGSWIKALSNLDELIISWAIVDNPATAEALERKLLHLFRTHCLTCGTSHTMPFGNLESYILVDGVFRRERKPHGIANWKSR